MRVASEVRRCNMQNRLPMSFPQILSISTLMIPDFPKAKQSISVVLGLRNPTRVRHQRNSKEQKLTDSNWSQIVMGCCRQELIDNNMFSIQRPLEWLSKKVTTRKEG